MAGYLTALSIAGSDSSAGAGIQADIKTMSALGVYATTAVTAVTAQGPRGVEMIETMPPELVYAQISAALEYMQPQAIKIGMLANAGIIRAVTQALKNCRDIPVVLDPVLMSSSGAVLLNAEGIDALKQLLLPIATLITPNIPEAELLKLGFQDHNAVLLKGGHSADCKYSVDRLFLRDGSVHIFKGPRIPTQNTHGTGCTLSSAITAFLARGCDLLAACAKAKQYVENALREGMDVEMPEDCHGPLNHLFEPLPLLKKQN